MIYLAWLHLLNRKRQTALSVIGIFVGTAAFIGISTFFQGFQDLLVESLVSGDAHIKIQAREQPIEREEVEQALYPEAAAVHWKRLPAGLRASPSIENVQGWLERLEADPRVVAATPVYTSTALVVNGTTTYSLTVTGMRPEDQVKVTNIETKMTGGSLLMLSRGTGLIVIGADLAALLTKQVGDSLTITTASGATLPFKIVGLYSTGNKMADRSGVYVSLSDSQKIGQATGKISQISVRVQDYKQAAAMASAWKATSPDRVESWDQANENLMSMLRSQNITRFTVTAIIMLVAGFGISNVLTMVVAQKRRDIAILRSFGHSPSDIIQLFLLQGFLLGALGALLGSALGFIICKCIGEIHMGGPTAGTFHLDFNWAVYLEAFAISNLVAVLACLFPAWSASRLTPIEIIRSGAE